MGIRTHGEDTHGRHGRRPEWNPLFCLLYLVSWSDSRERKLQAVATGALLVKVSVKCGEISYVSAQMGRIGAGSRELGELERMQALSRGLSIVRISLGNSC
jgi:hypothetical protein